MNFSLWVAKRYFLFGSKANFINVVSLISIMVVGFVSFALVIALSVFNGLEDLIRSLYKSFDPDIKISAQTGKFFELTDKDYQALASLDGIAFFTEVLEDYALAKYKEEQTVVKIKGVSDDFFKEKRLDDKIIEGKINHSNIQSQSALIGQGVQYLLNLDIEGSLYPLVLLYPNAKYVGSAMQDKLINSISTRVSGVFAIEKQYDDNYVIIPIHKARQLLLQEKKISAIEIKPKPNYSSKDLINEIKRITGNRLLVQDSDEQHKQLISAIQVEKLVMYLIVAFILLIASLNIFFCLTMLAIKKKNDITLMSILGADKKVIRDIFLLEGVLIAFSGAIIGVLLGVFVAVVQQHFGIVSMGMETSIVDAYPVRLSGWDVLLVLITVIGITLTASVHPALKAAKSIDDTNLIGNN